MVGFTLQPWGPGPVAINLRYKQVPRSGRTRLAQPRCCLRLPGPSPVDPLCSSKIHLFHFPKHFKELGKRVWAGEHQLLGGGLENISRERKGAALLRGEQGDLLEIAVFYRTAAPAMD